jgi:hypothetical protein
MNLADVLKFLIEKGPGRTGEELIQAIRGGRAGEEVRVRQELEYLSDYGHITRLGRGNNRDPFRYYPPNTTSGKKNPRAKFSARGWVSGRP